MSERQANAPTMRALLPSRLVPEDMLSEWQGPNLPNTKNYAPAEDSIGGMIRNALLSGVAGVGGFTGLPMSDEGNRAALLGELLAAGIPLVGGVKQLAKLVGAENKVAQGIKAYHGTTDQALRVPDPQMAVEVPGAAFFSSNRDVADQYQWPREYGEIIDGPRGQVIEANLDLQNPMTVDFGGDVGDAIRLEKLVREAKGKGHDALVVHNVDDSVDSSQILGTTYAVFNKEQIQFVKKYGIAGALSAGAINELEARQLQAQGYQ